MMGVYELHTLAGYMCLILVHIAIVSGVLLIHGRKYRKFIVYLHYASALMLYIFIMLAVVTGHLLVP